MGPSDDRREARPQSTVNLFRFDDRIARMFEIRTSNQQDEWGRLSGLDLSLGHVEE